MRFTVLLALVATFTLAPGLQAQEADQEVRQELRTMVTGDQATDDRAVLLEFLQREDVERVAAERGIDLDRLEAGVQTLDEDAAGDLARRVLDTEGDLVGGDTVIITSTTIIIVLLVLILLSV